MTITGYSDRINHALAFAAKHHDQQVRKGTRPPYLTRPANVAIILTRYGRDDYTIVAGILHDVIEDCVLEAYSHSMLEQRIGEKFGREVLDIALAVTPRRVDDDGIELSHGRSARRSSGAFGVRQRFRAMGLCGGRVAQREQRPGGSPPNDRSEQRLEPLLRRTRSHHPRPPSRLRPADGARIQRGDHARVRSVIVALEEWSDTAASYGA